ncbi:MAG: ABC transporter ATP-binding protein [Clostridia bacterium]|nr:ABC transporter ATP-binding protein [Clostridia bacterium]MBQ8430077.1 ABC transporter ATP-binding protein [Clostridia bacterium]
MAKIRRFFKYYKPHRKLFLIDLICSFTISVCNMFYPMIARTIMNDYVPNGNLRLLITWAIVLAAIYALKGVLTFIVGHWGHVLGVRIQGDMRRDLFRHIETLPFSYFDENQTGSIMSRILNDLFEVSELAHHGPEDMFNSFISIIGAIVMLCLINPWLGVIVLCYVPLMIIFAAKARVRMSNAFDESRKKVAELNAEIESSVSGIRVTKAYNAEKTEAEKFDDVNTRFKHARSQAYRAMGGFQAGMSAFNDYLYLIALVSGGLLFFYKIISAADFTAYILYITMLLTPIRTMINLFEQIQDGLTGFNRFCVLMDTPSEYEPENPIESDLDGDIVFENVNFGYKSSDGKGGEVLKNVSFTVKKGQTVALVGSSGGGKTTICHLLPRFYVCEDGKITIGGTNINNVTTAALREKIAIVSQDVFLFSGSVRDNILYGTKDKSEEDMILAAKRANIHDYVTTLPSGYDTEVGERGVKLSGGQKQRISIARAFLKNPEILILDEATSALDNMTEMQVQKALSELSVGRTTIVVAHRLSTVKNADEILVLTDGEITERGSHETLIQMGGLYEQLYRYQFRE